MFSYMYYAHFFIVVYRIQNNNINENSLVHQGGKDLQEESNTLPRKQAIQDHESVKRKLGIHQSFQNKLKLRSSKT